MLLIWVIVITLTTAQGWKECSQEDFGVFLPHETLCTKYYECRKGIKIERECSRGLYFDGTEKLCKTGECRENFKIYNLQFLPHETDCNKYYMILSDKQFEYACPTGLHFNLESEVCDYPGLANCFSVNFV